MAALANLPHNHDLHHLTRSLYYLPEHKKRVAIDCGAHQGIWTRELMKHFRCVHAFEPQEDNYKSLEKVVRESTKDGHVGVAYNFALGFDEYNAELKPGLENTGQYHLCDLEGWFQPVEVHKLDNFNFINVDFLKLDVEGYESLVLEGAIETIKRWHPMILLEENGLALKYYGIDPAACNKILEPLGYEVVRKFNKDYLFIWKLSQYGPGVRTPSTM